MLANACSDAGGFRLPSHGGSCLVSSAPGYARSIQQNQFSAPLIKCLASPCPHTELAGSRDQLKDLMLPNERSP